MVSNKWSSHDLTWEVLIPGRLARCRLRMCNRCVDIIHCYQHSCRHDTHRLQQRKQWWTTLQTLVTSLPRRNVLLVQGDVNCSLHHCAELVGHSHFNHNNHQILGSQHSDQDQFETLIRNHHLVALHTWHQSQATYHQHLSDRSRHMH